MDKQNLSSKECKFKDIYKMEKVEDVPWSFTSNDPEIMSEFYMVSIKIFDKAGETSRAQICRYKLKELDTCKQEKQ